MGDRDEKGRLLPGHSIRNPGKPRNLQEQEYRDVLHRTVTPAIFETIIRKMIDHVERTGSIRAAQFLTEQLIGKPTQRTEDAQTAMPEWLMMVLQVNDNRQIGLVNDAYIALSDGDAGDSEVIEGIIVDTTITKETNEATKTPDKCTDERINVDTTIETGEWVGG